MVVDISTAYAASKLISLERSYLQFVPSRYGLSCCLTTATDCLLAKLRGILMPDKKNKATELRLHSLALSSLQSSLSDPCASVAPETLCASQLLGLHAVCRHLIPRP